MTTIPGNLHNGAQWRDMTKQNHGSSKGLEDSAAFFQPSPLQIRGKEREQYKQMPDAPEPEKSGIDPPDKKDNLEIGLPYDPVPDLKATQPYESIPELQFTLPYEAIPDLSIGLPYDPFPDANLVALHKPVIDPYFGSQHAPVPGAGYPASYKEATKIAASLVAGSASKFTQKLAAQMIEKKGAVDSGLGE